MLKECHSIFNSGVGAGVPLKFIAMSGSGSATQKIKEYWTQNGTQGAEGESNKIV